LARALVGDARPVQVLLYARRRGAAAVARLGTTHGFDVAHAQLVRAAPYLPRDGHPPVVIDLIDALSANFARRAARERGPAGALAAWVPAMAPELAAATVAVVPMRAGSGLQNKVLEAMAVGTPVVTTPRATAALEVRPGEHLLVADDAAGLAAAALDLLRAPGRARVLARAARALVERRYRWEDSAAGVDGAWQRAVDAARRS